MLGPSNTGQAERQRITVLEGEVVRLYEMLSMLETTVEILQRQVGDLRRNVRGLDQ